MECRISPEVELCTGNDLLCFQTIFCYLAGLIILNKSGKRKLTVFFNRSCVALKRSAVNSYHAVKFDKCGKNNHDPASKKLSTAQE